MADLVTKSIGLRTMSTSDLSVIYITANVLPRRFARKTQEQLLKAIGGLPLVSVSKKPMDFGENICVGNTPRSQANIYRQALIGAKAATTRYMAIAEDDVLYSPEHFKYRPPLGVFAYGVNNWSVFTWGTPMFTLKSPLGRKNLNALICERKLFVEAIEERFRLWPDDNKISSSTFGEPRRYDKHLGTTPYPVEGFYINPPNIVFYHQTALSFKGLGTRKRPGQVRATEISYWGRAEDTIKLYV